jgi:hypothetical protein
MRQASGIAAVVAAIAMLGGWPCTTPAPAAAQELVAAVLPSSRSVQVGTAATVFATIINTGTTEATGCSVAVGTVIPASFAYYTTSAATNAVTSGPNPAVTIGPGTPQSFLLVFTPAEPFGPVDVQLRFDCANTAPAPVTSGLNTVLLSASTAPVPDIVALAATLSNDGVVTLNSLGAFAVATVNIGAGGTITASAVGAGPSLPVTFTICRTDPGTGQCLQAPTPTVTTSIDPNETPTFSVFLNAIAYVPFLPAVNRVALRFRDAGGITRGSTSVAVKSGSLAGSWRVTVRGTAQVDGGGSLPLVPATFEGAVAQHGNALSGTLLLDNVDDILAGLPPSCSVSCSVPGTCFLSCPGLLSCTFTCTPATTRCAEPLDLAGTVNGVLAFGLQGGAVLEGSCVGSGGSGTLVVQDTMAITLSGSPITLTGAHAGRDDRSCAGTGVFSGMPCLSFSFSGTYDQAILTPASVPAAAEGARRSGPPSGALWGAVGRALGRLALP